MEEQKISIETAKLAKEKGFNIECLNFYTKPNSKMFGIDEHGRSYSIQNSIKNKIYTIGKEATLNFKNVLFAPTQSLLQRWLREVHNIDVIIWKNGIDGSYRVEDILLNNKELTNLEFEDSFDNYENALEEGLYEALKLIKNEA